MERGASVKQLCQGKPHQEGIKAIGVEGVCHGDNWGKSVPSRRNSQCKSSRCVRWFQRLEQKEPGRESSYPQQCSSHSFSYHALCVLHLSSHICDCFAYLGVCLFLVCLLAALGSS